VRQLWAHHRAHMKAAPKVARLTAMESRPTSVILAQGDEDAFVGPGLKKPRPPLDEEAVARERRVTTNSL